MGTDNYTFIAPPRHVNKWFEETSEAKPGWEYQVRDGVTGAIVPVFIPDASFGKEQAETLILHELAKVRDVHTLGS